MPGLVHAHIHLCQVLFRNHAEDRALLPWLEERIWPLAARKINGIGPKANAKLETLGIHTIGELANADAALLLKHFGKNYGAWMLDAAHGRDERVVKTYSEPKSISRETTFEDDLHPVRDREKLTQIFTDLCVRVADDLKRKGVVGKLPAMGAGGKQGAKKAGKAKGKK